MERKEGKEREAQAIDENERKKFSFVKKMESQVL
jgi:hypothetical protein